MEVMGQQLLQPSGTEDWTRSDEYQNSFLIPKDEVLDAIVKNSNDQGLPDIAVSVAQGKFLHLLVRSLGAKRILEVGTLGAYSTTWFARGIPADGRVVTLEISAHHVKVAKENLKIAGVKHLVEVIEEPAADTLATLHPVEPFDLVFIDADKTSNVTYFTEAKRLVRKGGVIIVDNVIRFGRVADLSFTDPSDEGVRNLLRAIQGDKEVDATTIATVGERGFDGHCWGSTIYRVEKRIRNGIIFS